MAIITKIREKSGVAIILITLGLALFLVGSDLLMGNSQLFGGGKQTIGEIDGKEIAYQEFLDKTEELKNKYAISIGRQPSEEEMTFVRREAWNELVYKYALQKDFEKLALQASPEEVKDMVQGNNLHPLIAQRFTNPQTGEIDRNMIVQYLKTLPQNQEEYLQFAMFENSLPMERTREKYAQLFALSTYIPTAEGKREYIEQNNRISGNILFVPYSSIPDTEVKVTDDLLKAYFDKNKAKFKRNANRAIEYVSFPITASAADSTDIKAELEKLKAEFATTDSDTSFTSENSDGARNFRLLRPGELPEEIKNEVLEPKKVWGTFIDQKNNRFVIHKLVSIEEDSVAFAKASHILFAADSTSDKAKIKKDAEDVLKQINEGGDFGYLASRYNTDATRNTNGSLGWIKENDPAFDKNFMAAVMAAGKTGVLAQIVESKFGYHIIKIDAQRSKTLYKIASVSKEIASSEATRSKAYEQAGKVAEATNAKEYVDKVKNIPGLISLQALSISKEANNINNLTGSRIREIIRWAYDEERKLGDISNIFELEDAYIVALLRDTNEEGEARLEDVKETVTQSVKDELKAKYIMAKISNPKAPLDDIAKSFKDVSVASVDNLSIQSMQIRGVGAANKTIGRAFASKKGDRIGPVEESTGVVMMDITNVDEAGEVADYKTYKDRVVERRVSQLESKVLRAVKKLADVKDEIAKYY